MSFVYFSGEASLWSVFEYLDDAYSGLAVKDYEQKEAALQNCALRNRIAGGTSHYAVRRTDAGQWEVGFEDDEQWSPESSHSNKAEAQRRCDFINGITLKE